MLGLLRSVAADPRRTDRDRRLGAAKYSGTVPITLRDWAIIVGGTSLVMWAGELSRWIKRRQRA